MTNEQKISVVVPFHSLEKQIANCLQSLQNQTYKNFEVIMLANNVHDKSRQIAEEFAKQDGRFLLFDCPLKTKNIAKIRQYALCLATGKYLAWVDGDDVVLPNFLECLHTAITQSGAQMAACGTLNTKKTQVKIKPKKSKKNRVFLAEQAQKMCLISPNFAGGLSNKMLLTKLAKQISFDEYCNIFEDLDFCLRYLNLCSKVVQVPQKNYVYIYRNGSLTKKPNPKYIYRRLNTLNKIVSNFEGTQVGEFAKYNRGMQTVAVMHLTRKNKKYACEQLKNKIFAKYLDCASKAKCKIFGVAKYAKILINSNLKKLNKKIKAHSNFEKRK